MLCAQRIQLLNTSLNLDWICCEHRAYSCWTYIYTSCPFTPKPEPSKWWKVTKPLNPRFL